MNLLVAVCLIALGTGVVVAQPGERVLTETSVGLEGKVIFRYDGPRVVPVPIDDEQGPPDVLLRIADRSPASDDGGAWLYDVRFIAEIPGEIDLTEHLIHEDGTPLGASESAVVRVLSLLPDDHGGDLIAEEREGVEIRGGYFMVLAVIAAAWVAPIGWILAKRRDRAAVQTDGDATAALTDEERLRSLARSMVEGRLPAADRARLERLVILRYRDEAGAGDADAASALRAIRRDADAAGVLDAIEAVLHQPSPSEDDAMIAARALEGFMHEEAAAPARAEAGAGVGA
ncbi:MAG: hypothetical protein AAGJ54_02730 [Planctomycetota bacterium]